MYSVPHLKKWDILYARKKCRQEPQTLITSMGSPASCSPSTGFPSCCFRITASKPLSTDAKTLYGILLDRMSLSARNGWLDKAGRVFIIYTVQEVQDSLGCADKKATKLLRELEEYSLIERKRRGLGKPDLIYVKNFFVRIVKNALLES